MSDLRLTIPEELEALLAEGLWPNDRKSANQQHFHPTISKSDIQKFAPEETEIFLYPPPFSTVRAYMKSDSFWSDPNSAFMEIDPDSTILIGDFGLGSDAPIALDYRKDKNTPAVIRLLWAKDGNHWVEIAPNFAAFAKHLNRIQ